MPGTEPMTFCLVSRSGSQNTTHRVHAQIFRGQCSVIKLNTVYIRLVWPGEKHRKQRRMRAHFSSNNEEAELRKQRVSQAHVTVKVHCKTFINLHHHHRKSCQQTKVNFWRVYIHRRRTNTNEREILSDTVTGEAGPHSQPRRGEGNVGGWENKNERTCAGRWWKTMGENVIKLSIRLRKFRMGFWTALGCG